MREPGAKGCTLVTVDDAQEVVAIEPRWLDVVRWQTCRVDAAGARDGDEALQRFEHRLERLLPECDGRLLALRVEFHGATAAHAPLAAKSAHWIQEVRRAALDGGSGRVWVEKVVFKTAPPAAPGVGRGDAPLAELAACLDELRGDDERLRAWGDRALEDLEAQAPRRAARGARRPRPAPRPARPGRAAAVRTPAGPERVGRGVIRSPVAAPRADRDRSGVEPCPGTDSNLPAVPSVAFVSSVVDLDPHPIRVQTSSRIGSAVVREDGDGPVGLVAG